MALDTAHPTQRTARAHQRTGAQWPRPLPTQHKAPSQHTVEQELSGPGHRTRNTTHGASTLVSGSQKAEDTAHTAQQTERAHR